MPSPIAHAAMGYIVYRALRRHKPEEATKSIGRFPRLLVITIGLSLLPDLDSVPGIISGDFGRFHNTVSNSLFTGVAVAVGIGSAVWLKDRSGFKRWFAIGLVCYELHVLMDLFTLGRGVMLAWPLSAERIKPFVNLFYGVRWSEGLISSKHLWTLGTELGLVGLLTLVFGLPRLKRLLRGRREETDARD